MDSLTCNEIKIEISKLDYLRQVYCYEKGNLNEICVNLNYNIWLNKINYYKSCINKKDNYKN
jgi:hypothetical protein